MVELIPLAQSCDWLAGHRADSMAKLTKHRRKGTGVGASQGGPRRPKGARGLRGPAGPAGPSNQRYEALADRVDGISRELRTQFQRFAQVQQQLDAVTQAVKQSERQHAATERLPEPADRDVAARRPN